MPKANHHHHVLLFSRPLLPVLSRPRCSLARSLARLLTPTSFGLLLNEYLRHCGTGQRRLCELQQRLWSEEGMFAAVCRTVQAAKGKGKATLKSIMRRELEAIAAVLPDRHQLPIDPRIEVGLLKVEKCRVMSSAKVPLWLVFENAEVGADDVIVMFKAGDDLRQDTMVLQLLQVRAGFPRRRGRGRQQCTGRDRAQLGLVVPRN